MYEYKAELIRVVDGDTYHLLVDLGFGIHIKQIFRLKGVNCPESHKPSTLEEFNKAQAATKYAQLCLERALRVTVYSPGKYNRYICDIAFQDESGRWLDLANALLLRGHATRA